MIQRPEEVYKIVKVTNYHLGEYEAFLKANEEDMVMSQDWSVCMGAMTLLDSLDFEEALEVAREMSSIEIFCDAEYFLDYVCDGELVVFDDAKTFCAKANLLVPSVIYKTSTGKVIQIFK